MKKLKSFTIVELCVTLLISGVVIGIAYYAYSLFLYQYKKQEAKSALIREYLLFQKAIRTDIDQAEDITDSIAYLTFRKLSNETAKYNFANDFIYRNTLSATDSFRIKKTEYYFSTVTETSDLVNEIHIVFDLKPEKLRADFKKIYSAQQIMEHDVE
jgi:Tfp pilus assembly protein PilE